MYIHTNVEQFIVSDTWANMLIGYAFAISLRLMCGFIVSEPRSLLFAFIFVLLDFGGGQGLWFLVYFRLFSYFYCNEIFKDFGDLFNRSSEGSSRLRVRSMLAYPAAGQS